MNASEPNHPQSWTGKPVKKRVTTKFIAEAVVAIAMSAGFGYMTFIAFAQSEFDKMSKVILPLLMVWVACKSWASFCYNLRYLNAQYQIQNGKIEATNPGMGEKWSPDENQISRMKLIIYPKRQYADLIWVHGVRGRKSWLLSQEGFLFVSEPDSLLAYIRNNYPDTPIHLNDSV